MYALIVFTVLIVALIAVLPRWSYSKDWSTFPAKAIGVVFVLVLLLWLIGWLDFSNPFGGPNMEPIPPEALRPPPEAQPPGGMGGQR